jgi:hypothetical protein
MQNKEKIDRQTNILFIVSQSSFFKNNIIKKNASMQKNFYMKHIFSVISFHRKDREGKI